MISFLKILGIKERDFIIALKVGAILDKSFLKYPPKLLPNAFNILKSLSKEYKLCLTSNTGITSPETYLKYLESLKIKNFFDKIYFSNQLEVAKPSIEMFNLILKDFNVEPQKVIHIGDNVFTDMFGAKKAGLKSILINKRKSVTYGFKIIPDNTIADISELSRLKI
jgi:putative hydrolase of the HAD superfamily